jgi:pectate lyase-like protein
MKQWLWVLLLSVLFPAGISAQQSTKKLASTYVPKSGSEQELADLANTVVVTDSQVPLFVVFTLNVANSSTREADFTLRVTLDGNTTGVTQTFTLTPGNKTLQWHTTERGLSLGSHTWRAYVTSKESTVSYLAPTTTLFVGALTIGDAAVWSCDAAQAQKFAVVTCPPYEAVGDFVNDDTAEIQDALNKSRVVHFPPGTYKISSELTVTRANAVLYGAPGATLKLANNVNTRILNIGTTSGVTIDGLTIDGNRSAQTSCVTGPCQGITAGPLTNLKVLNSNFINIKNDALQITGATQTLVQGNYFGDIGSTVVGESHYGAGIVFTGPDSSQFVTITGNLLKGLAGAGIGYGLGKDAVISDNVISDAGKSIDVQALVVGYGASTNTEAERVKVSNNVIRGTTRHGCIRIGGTDITVEKNIVSDCRSPIVGSVGIAAITTNTKSVRGRNLHIINNSLRILNDDDMIPIELSRCDGCSVNGNRVIVAGTSTADMVIFNDVRNGTLSENDIKGGNVCLRLADNERIAVTGNRCRGQLVKGILMTTTTTPSKQVSFVENLVADLGARATGGIDVGTGSPTDISLVGNTVLNAPAALTISGPDGGWASGNYAPNTDCSLPLTATINPFGPQITCTLLQIRAGGNITALTAGAKGKVITLKFLGGGTLVNGGDLDLNGNYSPGAGGTITLISTGTKWHEIGRSGN